jgi:hypothetical protein
MKRLSIIALFAILVLGVMTPRANAIGVMGSWWNMNESNDDGFGFGLRQKIPLIPPVLALDTRASWIRFSDADLNVFPLEATGLVSLGLLYAGLGAGYYIFDAQDYSVDNNFGWYVLGGIQVGTGAANLFGEIKWTSLSADIHDVKANINNVPNNIDADGVGFNVGLMFGL